MGFIYDFCIDKGLTDNPSMCIHNDTLLIVYSHSTKSLIWFSYPENSPCTCENVHKASLSCSYSAAILHQHSIRKPTRQEPMYRTPTSLKIFHSGPIKSLLHAALHCIFTQPLSTKPKYNYLQPSDNSFLELFSVYTFTHSLWYRNIKLTKTRETL